MYLPALNAHAFETFPVPVSSPQIGLGLDRLPCPSGLGAVFNVEKKARARNLVYAGGRVRKLRMSYLDSPGMQVIQTEKVYPVQVPDTFQHPCFHDELKNCCRVQTL